MSHFISPDHPTAYSKLEVRRGIIHYLFDKANKTSFRTLNELCERHSLHCPNGQKAFIYGGEAYSLLDWRPTARAINLHKSLHPEMEAWLEEARALKEDKHLISTYLACLLSVSHDLFTVAEYAPECIQPLVVESLGLWGDRFVPAVNTEPFNTQHAKAIQRLKERIVLNMLL